MCVSVMANRLRECVDMMSEILGPLFLTDRQLTMLNEIGPGFRAISPQSSSKTDRPLYLVKQGK